MNFFSGKDIIGLAETGSGKTGAFAIPVIHTLLDNPQRLYALVLTPTRLVEQFLLWDFIFVLFEPVISSPFNFKAVAANLC